MVASIIKTLVNIINKTKPGHVQLCSGFCIIFAYVINKTKDYED